MDTIVALSSGGLPSGVAVIRISGPAAFESAASILGAKVAFDRTMRLVTIVDPTSLLPIDMGLACGFKAPRSFTGEDCVELQLHGSKAVVDRTLSLLCAYDRVRLAEAGEFARQAFVNGKLDLTSAEGLADLIDAQTEAQRSLAFTVSEGVLANTYRSWREVLLRFRALLEADIDFADEDDVPGSVSEEIFASLPGFISELNDHLARIRKADRIRDGYRIAIVGPPNVGKSTLLNALAGREAAIVTEVPGTTRDVVEVQLDLGGYLVVVADTAGIRETDDRVEQEGIKRAHLVTQEADLVLQLSSGGEWIELGSASANNVRIHTKCDIQDVSADGEAEFAISAKSGTGMDALVAFLTKRVESALGEVAERSAGNARHAARLRAAVSALETIRPHTPLELTAEALRVAGEELAQLTGEIGTEDLLGEIFSAFCIGK